MQQGRILKSPDLGVGWAGHAGKGLGLGPGALLAQVDHALHLVIRAEPPAALQREVERRRLHHIQST